MSDTCRAALERVADELDRWCDTWYAQAYSDPRISLRLIASNARTALDTAPAPASSTVPPPPAEGEVGELVAWLRCHAEVLNPSARIRARRICDLLERHCQGPRHHR